MMRDSALPGWPLLMKREDAANFFSVSLSTYDTLSKSPGFPQPVSLTDSLKRWHRLDLEAWVEDRRTAVSGIGNPWDDA